MGDLIAWGADTLTWGADSLTWGEYVEPASETPRRGGGAPYGARNRRYFVKIDDETIVVDTVAQAMQLLAQAEEAAQITAQAKAQELAKADKVRLRTAKRAAPVVRIETPNAEPVPEIVDTQRRVAEVNARLQEIYVNALRTELIARELKRRMDEDEEDALAMLIL